MNEDYGPNFITVTDDDGNELELEHLDTIEWNGNTYFAFCPAVTDESEEETYELVILKAVEEEGEAFLSTPDSDEEYNAVYDQFMLELFDEDEDDG